MPTIPSLDWNQYLVNTGDGEFGPLQATRVKRLTRLEALRVDLKDQHTNETLQVLIDVTTGDLLKANPAAPFEITRRTVDDIDGFRRVFNDQSAA